MTKDLVPIEYADGVKNSWSAFTSEKTATSVFIIIPAMGVRASFYKDLAAKIVQKGHHVATIDWRGLGESSVRPARGIDFGYKDLLEDCRVTIEAIKKYFPESEPIIIGHSLGGQIGSLLISRYPELVNKISLIASCSVYHKGWDGWGAVKIKIVGQLFYRIANLVGYFPGDEIGFGGRGFPKVMHDWGNTVRTGKYRLLDETFDYEKSLSKSTASVKAVSIAGDPFAPERAVKNLLAKFNKQARTTHIHLTKEMTGQKLDHYSWAKKSDKIVDLLTDW